MSGTFPSQIRSYLWSLNNQITFSTLNDTMAQMAYGAKNFAVATGAYTVKYTCDGTTGPSSGADHTDRTTSKTACTTRATTGTGPLSYWIIQDGNGVQWMWAYLGASDDVGRLSYSKGALFVPNGTQIATATDEIVTSTAQSLIGNTASGNRVWHAQLSTDKKCFRLFVMRANVCVGTLWSFENVTSAISGATNSWSPAFVGMALTTGAPATIFNGSQTVGIGKPTMAGIDVSTNEIFGYETPPTSAFLDGVNCEAQGSNGSLFFPLSIWGNTSGNHGKQGNMIDWYKDGNNSADGTLTTDKTWVHITFSGSNAAGLALPWDGLTVIQTA